MTEWVKNDGLYTEILCPSIHWPAWIHQWLINDFGGTWMHDYSSYCHILFLDIKAFYLIIYSFDKFWFFKSISNLSFTWLLRINGLSASEFFFIYCNVPLEHLIFFIIRNAYYLKQCWNTIFTVNFVIHCKQCIHCVPSELALSWKLGILWQRWEEIVLGVRSPQE